MCLHTFALFWLRKTSVIVKMYQLSFHVCPSSGYIFIFSYVCVIYTSVLSFPHSFTLFSFFCYVYFFVFTCPWIYPTSNSLKTMINKVYQDWEQHFSHVRDWHFGDLHVFLSHLHHICNIPFSCYFKLCCCLSIYFSTCPICKKKIPLKENSTWTGEIIKIILW